MLKEYRKAAGKCLKVFRKVTSGQFLKAIGKPPGNSLITLIPAGHCSDWLGVMKHPIGDKAE
jgi:hypothetical protein